MSLSGIFIHSSKYNSFPYTVPSGGVVAGGMGKIGDTVVVYYETKAEGEKVAAVYRARKMTLPKVTGTAINQGAIVYYDAAEKKATGTAGTNVVIGRCLEAAASADTEVLVDFDGAYPVEAAAE